jgi:hypothetical protein
MQPKRCRLLEKEIVFLRRRQRALHKEMRAQKVGKVTVLINCGHTHAMAHWLYLEKRLDRAKEKLQEITNATTE